MKDSYRRLRPSLFGRHLRERLLDEIVWLKSEALPNFLDFYVDNGQLDLIDNNAHHYISGRRGTGKTHLLGSFHEQVSKRTDELSVFISLVDIHSASPLELDFSDDTVARHAAKLLFTGFLREFFELFLPAVEARGATLDPPTRKKIDDKLTQLLTEVELGSPVSSTPPSETETTDQADELGRTGGLEGSASLGLSTFEASLKASAGGTKSSSRTRKTTRTNARYYETDYGRVKRLVKDILSLCNIRLLHILIDEWMELDKGEASKLQNYFAQFVKKTFFGAKTISVKIGSIWNRTSLYEQTDMQKSVGMQIGHDIQHTVDLDSSFYKTEEEIVEFVKGLLLKRLSRKLPALSKFELQDGSIDDEFIIEIFDDMRNFKVFITAGHGIPRDLMRVFQKSFQRIKADFSRFAMTRDLIEDVARDIYAQEKRETINPSSATKEMWVRINKYMEQSGRRFFFVDPKEYDASTAFRGLIDHELVHEVHAPTLPREVRRLYKVFMIDYGTFIDWRRAASTSAQDLLAESILPNLTGEEVVNPDGYIVHLITDSARYLTCQSCEKLVERTSAVLVKHGLCPICGDPAVKTGVVEAQPVTA